MPILKEMILFKSKIYPDFRHRNQTNCQIYLQRLHRIRKSFLTIFLHFLSVTFSLILYQHVVKYVPFQMKHPTEKTCYSELSPITFNHITYKHHEFQMWESKSTASICTCRV